MLRCDTPGQPQSQLLFRTQLIHSVSSLQSSNLWHVCVFLWLLYLWCRFRNVIMYRCSNIHQQQSKGPLRWIQRSVDHASNNTQRYGESCSGHGESHACTRLQLHADKVRIWRQRHWYGLSCVMIVFFLYFNPKPNGSPINATHDPLWDKIHLDSLVSRGGDHIIMHPDSDKVFYSSSSIGKQRVNPRVRSTEI